ncbi:MAG: DsbA family oxidoreductase [Pseudomonadota bacterium]|jgi:predicted DsbA family dithiol-disulfide isomerase|nr:DsbA family oxidoreductase [Pseudomonadota bacterium]
MTLHIEMVSDLVCPWCWVGLRRLKGAMALVPDLDVAVLFRPFELDPTIPAGGTDYKAYMKSRFGSDQSRDRANQMRDALIQYGEEEGIPFDFDRITRRPNSFDAHRLVYWAQGQSLGMQAKEALFEAYFAKGLDIGDHQVLITLASEIGLDANIVSDLLASDADVETTRQEQSLFRQMGISGVPTFIALRQIAVQGAESSEKLARFLNTAAAQVPAERPLAGA